MPENNGTQKRGLVINYSALLKAAKRVLANPVVRWGLTLGLEWATKKVVKAIQQHKLKREEKKAEKKDEDQ
jgi:hypothetical protein